MVNGTWRDDAGAVTENILLAVEAMGLGAVWTACYPYHDRMDPVKSSLGLPAEVVPYSVVALGHPAGDDQPKDKWKPEKVHYGKWCPFKSDTKKRAMPAGYVSVGIEL
jgi:nitroreductase